MSKSANKFYSIKKLNYLSVAIFSFEMADRFYDKYGESFILRNKATRKKIKRRGVSKCRF